MTPLLESSVCERSRTEWCVLNHCEVTSLNFWHTRVLSLDRFGIGWSQIISTGNLNTGKLRRSIYPPNYCVGFKRKGMWTFWNIVQGGSSAVSYRVPRRQPSSQLWGTLDQCSVLIVYQERHPQSLTDSGGASTHCCAILLWVSLVGFLAFFSTRANESRRTLLFSALDYSLMPSSKYGKIPHPSFSTSPKNTRMGLVHIS